MVNSDTMKKLGHSQKQIRMKTLKTTDDFYSNDIGTYIKDSLLIWRLRHYNRVFLPIMNVLLTNDNIKAKSANIERKYFFAVFTIFLFILSSYWP